MNTVRVILEGVARGRTTVLIAEPIAAAANTAPSHATRIRSAIPPRC